MRLLLKRSTFDHEDALSLAPTALNQTPTLCMHGRTQVSCTPISAWTSPCAAPICSRESRPGGRPSDSTTTPTLRRERERNRLRISSTTGACFQETLSSRPILVLRKSSACMKVAPGNLLTFLQNPCLRTTSPCPKISRYFFIILDTFLNVKLTSSAR